MQPSFPNAPNCRRVESPSETRLEELGLSVRTRNAVRSVGCVTVSDLLQLDLEAPIRGLGRKAKEELLTKLGAAGFAHPKGVVASEIRRIERNLDRVQRRVELALGEVTREIQQAIERIQKLKSHTPQAPS